VGAGWCCSPDRLETELPNVGAHFARRFFGRCVDIGPLQEVIEAANAIPAVPISLDHEQMLIVGAGTTMILG
jgi:hypothetical protein